MAENEITLESQQVFKAYCDMLDKKGWVYTSHPKDLYIETGAKGDHISMNAKLIVNNKKQLSSVHCFLPFEVPVSRRNEISLVITKINYGMVDGCFDYSYKDGQILFRLTSSFDKSTVSIELCEYMLMMSLAMVNKFAHKILAVIKSNLSVEDILKMDFNKED